MYRNELKYIVDPNTAKIISSRMQKLCRYDANADEKGFYRVTSLYFDDYNNSALNDNIIGQITRKKYRIRIYDGKDDFIRLEKKVKNNRGGLKESCKLSKDQYNMILRNDYEALKETSDNAIFQGFCLEGIARRLKPRVIVDYDRQTFVYDHGLVRVTLDHGVKHGVGNVDLFKKHQIYAPAVDPNQIILEVKFTGFLPALIKDMVQQSVSTRQSVSKYNICRSRSY